jgi:hypothetical protein
MVKVFDQRALNGFGVLLIWRKSKKDSIKEQKRFKLNKGDQSTCKKGMTEKKKPKSGNKTKECIEVESEEEENERSYGKLIAFK